MSATPQSVFGSKAELEDLVGSWRRDQACEELVEAFAESGLDDYTAQGLVDVSLQEGPPERVLALADPCDGARTDARRLTFRSDGTWLEIQEATGEHGNCCDYVLVEPGMIEIPADPGDPNARLRFEIAGDALSFALQWPDPCEDAVCRSQMAWATQSFTLGPWERVEASAQELASVTPFSLQLPEGWVAGGVADAYASADGRITLTIGTARPEPGQTVEDRVRINRQEEFAGCVIDPSLDRPVAVGGEPGILWNFECEGVPGLAANTTHDGFGYRLTMRAPSGAAAELEPLMAEVLAGFTFSD